MTTTTPTAAADIPTGPPPLPYRYDFAPHELDAIGECHRAHGFVIVKRLLSPPLVEALKGSVREKVIGRRPLEPGETRFHLRLIEESPPLASLLEHEPFMAIMRRLHGGKLTVHRTAGIAKAVGAGVGEWHTDYTFRDGDGELVGDALNACEYNSAWFYLNGTHPSRGGLAIMPDSNGFDWQPPEGFAFTPQRKSFHRVGDPPGRHARMDVPGLLPLFTDPGDLIVFGARTYHGVYPHRGSEVRLSCAIAFRPGHEPYRVPWELSDSARRFIASVPPRVRPMVEHYVGFKPEWNPVG